MVINDLHIVGIRTLPAETDAPLLIDLDTVLARSISPQGFQAVARRDPQVLKRLCAMQHEELPERRSLEVHGNPANRLAPEQHFGIAGSE
jgi:hypothetical protein